MWPLWPHVTNCDKVIPNLQSCERPKKVTHPNQIWSVRARVVIMTICDHQLPNPVTPVTHSKYSSYPFQILQLLQLPISVTPVTVSSYSSYPLQLLQLSILVTPVTYSSYPHQLLQLPIPVTPVTHSSYSRYPLQLPQLFKLLQLHQLPNSPPPLHFPPQVHLGPDLVTVNNGHPVSFIISLHTTLLEMWNFQQ